MSQENSMKIVKSVVPKRRQEALKWFGWGWKDAKFYVDKDKKARFTSDRYVLESEKPISGLNNYLKDNFDYDCINHPAPQFPETFTEPIINEEFIESSKSLNLDFSTHGEDRFIRCHGQNFHDLYRTRMNEFKRIPDVVVWPRNHHEVVNIVNLANKFNVVLIPFGGGTCVTSAVTCPENEKRSIVVVDSSQMNRMLWIDKESLVACFESGIIGQDLDRVLAEEGFKMGHEPDSYEFSSLGGWIATRASGMKKNTYGNIEDLVINLRMVTSKGVLEKFNYAPRSSCGPDFNHIILGSEGIFGIVTEVQVKIRPLPEVQKYGAILFHNFQSGFKFIREVAKKRCQPASFRLVENSQFRFGQLLKVDGGIFSRIADILKMFALKNILGFDLEQICVVSMVYEGDKSLIEYQEKSIKEIALKYDGYSVDQKTAEKAYLFTDIIAYLRDYAFEYGNNGESIEFSVSWNNLEQLYNNVNKTFNEFFAAYSIKYFMMSCRVSQVYDSGVCAYFTLGFTANEGQDRVKILKEIYNAICESAISSGGSISHHHGIGKTKTKWYKQSVSEVGVSILKTIKLDLDPKNIFAVGNILSNEDKIDFADLKPKL